MRTLRHVIVFVFVYSITLSSFSFAAEQSYKRIDLADLKVDIADLNGKNIVTSGKIQVIGSIEMVMLKNDEFDMAPVMVNAKGLPRDDKKKILNGCQAVLCKATISGMISKGGMLGFQLVADKVAWKR